VRAAWPDSSPAEALPSAAPDVLPPALAPGLPLAASVPLDRPRWVFAGPPSGHALAFAAIGLASLAAAARLTLDWPGLALFACPLRAATSVPCPGCGATHAFVHLAHGRPWEAFYSSPLAAALALGLWLHAGLTLLRLCGLRRALLVGWPDQQLPRLRRAAALLLLCNWAFVVFVSRGGAR
jgi:Protein of unknown function (DUF2752)